MTKHRRSPARGQGPYPLVVVTLGLCTLVLTAAIAVDVFFEQRAPAVTITTQPDPAWQILPAATDATTWNVPCGLQLDTTGLTKQEWHTWRDDNQTVNVGDLRFTTTEAATGYFTQVSNAVKTTCEGWTDADGQRWELPGAGEAPMIVLATGPTARMVGPGTVTPNAAVHNVAAPTVPTTAWQAALPGGAGQAWTIMSVSDQVILLSVDADPMPEKSTATRTLEKVTSRTRPLPPNAARTFA